MIDCVKNTFSFARVYVQCCLFRICCWRNIEDPILRLYTSAESSIKRAICTKEWQNTIQNMNANLYLRCIAQYGHNSSYSFNNYVTQITFLFYLKFSNIFFLFSTLWTVRVQTIIRLTFSLDIRVDTLINNINIRLPSSIDLKPTRLIIIVTHISLRNPWRVMDTLIKWYHSHGWSACILFNVSISTVCSFLRHEALHWLFFHISTYIPAWAQSISCTKHTNAWCMHNSYTMHFVQHFYLV